MKKLLYLLLICGSFSYAAHEQLTDEHKQNLFMNMLFERHLAKKLGLPNDSSLGKIFHERTKDVYWNFYCVLKQSDSDDIIKRARESAKLHALRQYSVAFIAIKATTPEYLLPNLGRPMYTERALTAMRAEFKGSEEELLERIRDIELLHKVHKNLAIPAMQEKQFHALRFTVMQRAIRLEELSESERDDIHVASKWVMETDPIVLSKEMADEAVGVYVQEGEAQSQACINKDASSKSCCVQ